MAYGICQNKYGGNPCQLAKDKVVQEADKSNFFCKNCGKPLKEVPAPPPPGSFWDKIKDKIEGHKRPILIGAVILLLGGLGICGWNMCSHSSKIKDLGQTNDSINITGGNGTDSTETTKGPDVNGPVTSHTPQPSQRIFGGKATYDAKANVIKVIGTLTLTDSEGETITLHKGDVIRGIGVKDGNILTQGECVTNGESRLFTGEVPF